MTKLFSYFRDSKVNLVALIFISLMMFTNVVVGDFTISTVNSILLVGIIIFAALFLWYKKEYLASHVVLLFYSFGGTVASFLRNIFGYNFKNKFNPFAGFDEWNWIWFIISLFIVVYLILTIIARYKEFSREYVIPKKNCFVVFAFVLIYYACFSSIGNWVFMLIVPLYILFINQRIVALLLVLRNFISSPINLYNALSNKYDTQQYSILFWLEYIVIFVLIGYIVYEIVLAAKAKEIAETDIETVEAE